jgi:hypothetical protein
MIIETKSRLRAYLIIISPYLSGFIITNTYLIGLTD